MTSPTPGTDKAMAAPAGPPTTLLLEDLTLVEWRPTDAGRALKAVRSSLPELAPWLPWATEAYDEDATHAYFRRSAEEWASGAGYVYALVSTSDPDGPVLGSAGLHRRIGPGGLEIGYWASSAHTGRRYATRAAALLTRAALVLPGVTRVEIHHDVANPASGRVPELLGFTRFATVAVPAQAPGETGQQHHWRLVAQNYAASPIPALLGDAPAALR